MKNYENLKNVIKDIKTGKYKGKLSIKEICNYANISRQTLYEHKELLQEVKKTINEYKNCSLAMIEKVLKLENENKFLKEQIINLKKKEFDF
jgi:predicted DNA-binding protein YlxM (UPF0122 family)